MRPSAFDEVQFFRAVHHSGARALLIGRRALVFLGLPVLTADYDFWLAIDDIEAFNAAADGFDLRPSHPAAEARRRGRYVLENDVSVYVPSLDDLILTKQVAARAKDLEDIRLLRILKEERR